jgi:peptide deformylase
MAILKIARMGHPALREVANAIEDPLAPEIQRLIQDMTETLADTGGVGLAATQVHVPLRLLIFHVPASRSGTGEDMKLRALINPVLTPLTDERVTGWEGCLSVPGLRGAVPRYTKLHLTALAQDGSPIDEILEDFPARVLQHEADHLDGRLYPSRVEDFRTFGYNEELDRYPMDLM